MRGKHGIVDIQGAAPVQLHASIKHAIGFHFIISSSLHGLLFTCTILSVLCFPILNPNAILLHRGVLFSPALITSSSSNRLHDRNSQDEKRN
jgi:hypothetical protein